jgi:hypothetical protein
MTSPSLALCIEAPEGFVGNGEIFQGVVEHSLQLFGYRVLIELLHVPTYVAGHQIKRAGTRNRRTQQHTP